MKKIALFFVFIVLFLCGCSNNSGASEITLVDYKEAKELVSEGAILIDVRTLEEYDTYHIEGAVLMSLDTIDEDVVEDVIDSFDKKVIVYCRSGKRSNDAAKKLVSLGYKNVYDLGSIDKWEE